MTVLPHSGRRKWRFVRPAIPVWYNLLRAGLATGLGYALFFGLFRYQLPTPKEQPNFSQVTLLNLASFPAEDAGYIRQWLTRHDPRRQWEDCGFSRFFPAPSLTGLTIIPTVWLPPLPELHPPKPIWDETPGAPEKRDYELNYRSQISPVAEKRRNAVMASDGRIWDAPSVLPLPKRPLQDTVLAIRPADEFGFSRLEILTSSGDAQYDLAAMSAVRQLNLGVEHSPVLILWATPETGASK